jgi:Xaa-Pro dipeptidase
MSAPGPGELILSSELCRSPHRFDLSAEGCRARRVRLFARLEPEPDVILLAGADHLAYFANFFVPDYVFQANDATAYLLLTPDKSILIHDNLLDGFAATAFVDDRRSVTWYRGQEPATDRQALVLELVREAFEGLKPKRAGVSLARLPGTSFMSLAERSGRGAVIDVDPVVRRMRIQKDADEIELLRTCGAVVSHVMEAAWKHLRPGMTELELFRFMRSEADRLVGHPVRLYGDVVSGPRCEGIGGPPSDRKIGADELVLLDFSVVIHGYRCDIADTKYLGTRPPVELQIRHKACVDAMDAASAMLRAGTGAAAVEQAVKRTITDAGFPGAMPGHAGHGVGLMHPEAPFFVPRSPETLMGREVVTLEPGIYEKDVCGIRIEHNYVVQDSGAERITHHDVTRLAI